MPPNPPRAASILLPPAGLASVNGLVSLSGFGVLFAMRERPASKLPP